jgi:hypothetical protein
VHRRRYARTSSQRFFEVGWPPVLAQEIAEGFVRELLKILHLIATQKIERLPRLVVELDALAFHQINPEQLQQHGRDDGRDDDRPKAVVVPRPRGGFVPDLCLVASPLARTATKPKTFRHRGRDAHRGWCVEAETAGEARALLAAGQGYRRQIGVRLHLEVGTLDDAA